MLDFGWAEFLIIAFILLLVVGPQDIPRIMYQAGKILRRLHYMKYALSRQFDDFMEKAEASASQEKGTDSAANAEEGTESATEIEEENLTMDERNPYFVKADEEADQDDADPMSPPSEKTDDDDVQHKGRGQ